MPSSLPRSAGLLLHPTSLPGPHGIGDLGPQAERFIDWLAAAGITSWQVLPLVPPGPGFSPYATTAAFAGNPLLLSLDRLVTDGLLPPSALTPPNFSPDFIDFNAVVAFKRPRIDHAAAALLAGQNPALLAAFTTFRATTPWLEDAATFLALKAAHGDQAWWDWPAPLRDRVPAALAAAQAQHAQAIAREAAKLFLFEHQWASLRTYAHARGVRLIGDLPIYVDRDSADVWSQRAQFRLDPTGAPLAVAGVPPDFFSETGQLWGNPLYDWDHMARDGHSWWVARLRRALAQVDLVRLDHFRGFSAFWEVPSDATDARSGHWVPGPGLRLFSDLKRALALDALPLIAEDLGAIDADVHALRDALDLPGMRILQFAFGQGADHPFLPHNFTANTVVYTATHDNDTTLGWWQHVDEGARDHLRRYLAVPGHDVVWDLIRAAFASIAALAIIPLQDVLALDSRCRMNTPGSPDGNWRWRVRAEAFNPELAARLRELAVLYSRHRPHPTPSRDDTAPPTSPE